MKNVIALLALSLLAGCAGTQYRAEYEHISHPFAGPPFGPTSEEDSLDHINLCGRKSHGRLYADTCLGYLTKDGGFYGPKLTGTVRVGVILNPQE